VSYSEPPPEGSATNTVRLCVLSTLRSRRGSVWGMPARMLVYLLKRGRFRRLGNQPFPDCLRCPDQPGRFQ
jgi:hypothetical protein